MSTAGRILGKDVVDVTKEERSFGKTVNFGILFGQTAFGLAKMLGIDSSVASEYIQSYFTHYVGVEQYIRKLEREGRFRFFVTSFKSKSRFAPWNR